MPSTINGVARPRRRSSTVATIERNQKRSAAGRLDDIPGQPQRGVSNGFSDPAQVRLKAIGSAPCRLIVAVHLQATLLRLLRRSEFACLGRRCMTCRSGHQAEYQASHQAQNALYHVYPRLA